MNETYCLYVFLIRYISLCSALILKLKHSISNNPPGTLKVYQNYDDGLVLSLLAPNHLPGS